MNKLCTLCREPMTRLPSTVWLCLHCDSTLCGSNTNTCGGCRIAAEYDGYEFDDDDGEAPVPVPA